MLLAGMLVAYSGHFHNTFHFDDGHAIQQNAYLRDLRNLPNFFTNTFTMSTLPDHCVYRPLTVALLAVEWHLGAGDPYWFHVVDFGLFVLLVAGICYWFTLLFPGAAGRGAALCGAAIFALHPACAETVNYLCQSCEILYALFLVAAVLAWWHDKRILAVALGAIGMLAKSPAIIFPALFVLTDLARGRRFEWKRYRIAVGAALAIYALTMAMTPAHFQTGSRDPWGYRLTQPLVLLHFAKTFVLPTELSPDTDWDLVSHWHSDAAIAGFLFVGLLGCAIVWLWRRERTRPVALGLAWFAVAFAPLGWYPLAEVLADHRTFVPFIGLALATAGGIHLLLTSRPAWTRAVVEVMVAILILFGVATHARCAVWATEATLWADAAQKSPHNGRALMNYGLTKMRAGDLTGAIQVYEQAKRFTPYYNYLWINEGIAQAALGKGVEAEAAFKTAAAYGPGDPLSFYFYARFLKEQGRIEEARTTIQKALAVSPQHQASRDLLAGLK